MNQSRVLAFEQAVDLAEREVFARSDINRCHISYKYVDWALEEATFANDEFNLMEPAFVAAARAEAMHRIIGRRT